MSRRLTALALTASLAALGSVAADDTACRAQVDAETGVETGVELCEQQQWFHAAAQPAGNLGAAGGGLPTFDTTEPGSNGGGYLTTSALHQNGSPHDPAESAHFTGTFEGALDTLLVTMYLLPPGDVAQSTGVWRVDAQLTIDGEVIATLDDKNVPLNQAGNLWQVDFGWVNIDARMAKRGLDLEAAHNIELSVHGTGIATSAAVLVYDNTNAPSGLTFNLDPETLDKKIVGRA